MDSITPELVVALAILVVVAAPIIWLFVSRHFKLKEKELELEAQTRRDWAALQGKTLDARLTALEKAFATLGVRCTSSSRKAGAKRPRSRRTCRASPGAATRFASYF